MPSVVWFVLLNIAAVALFAASHRLSADADLVSSLPYQSYVCLAALESAILFSPCLLTFLATNRWSARLATRTTVLLTLATSFIYIVDLGIFVMLREHLISMVFARFFLTIGPFLHAYLMPIHWLTLGGTLFIWGLVQGTTWKLSTWAANRSKTSKSDSLPIAYTLPLLAIAATPIAFALWPALKNSSKTLTEIQKNAERHPITATGYFAANNVPRFEPGSTASIRGTALLLANARFEHQLIDQYKQLEITRQDDSTRLPDIAIVVAECFRADVISKKTTPNLLRKTRNGLWLREHYSAGNASNLSFFGIMFGLEGHMFPYAAEMPIGLFDGFKQIGYRTGFFGRDDFRFFQMESFCHPNRFDESRFLDPKEDTSTDYLAIEHARQFFAREGDYQDAPEGPRIAIIYVYAPHNWYHDAVDQVHSLADAQAILPTDIPSKSQQDFRQFLNSIHFMDRAIEPLFDEDRIVIVTGDHGESFGEDGRSMHGSALSQVQLQVALVATGPGIPHKTIDRRTSHVDIFPTLVDSVGAQISAPHVISGKSLLQGAPTDRHIACRNLSSTANLILSSNPSEPFGYVGFLNWQDFTLAPGNYVDQFAEQISQSHQSRAAQASWSEAAPFRQWLQQQFGDGFARLPTEINPILRESLLSEDEAVVLKSIQITSTLPNQGVLEFRNELRALLASPHDKVRSTAFNLLHRLSAVD